jgi:hypothetical protein
MTRRRPAVLYGSLAMAAVGLLAACGDDPLPGEPSGGVVRVEIQGPASIAPGQSAQYSAIGILSDGTTRALPYSTWASSDSSLVQVTSSGIATAQSRTGEIRLSVTAAMSASKEVLVLPANTFRLVGSVTDMRGAPILNARVEVIGGPSATAGSNGAYRLYGVPPEADVRVTTDGYKTIEQHMQLTSHTSFNFRMALGVVEVSGNYTLTLEAGSNCSVPLAVELRRRSYDASVTQNGTRLEVVLTEPRFVIPDDTNGRFSGISRGLCPDGSTITARSAPTWAIATPPRSRCRLGSCPLFGGCNAAKRQIRQRLHRMETLCRTHASLFGRFCFPARS